MKWKFPILTAIRDFYKKHGLIKTIPFVVFIAIGAKFVIGNLGILLLNALGMELLFPGPTTRAILALFGV
jgi:hypothetical protein|tara:strand:+ start:265 stop:474 length:210 start_codon:yes stop_codon:yes gene_type:complete